MKIHIVQKGETLWEIANKYGVDFEQLKSINVHIASPDMIMPGMKIKIPTDNKHVKHQTTQEQHAKQQVETKVKKPSYLSEQQVAQEQSISLGEQSLPSPLSMPKLTYKQQPKTNHHHYNKEKYEKQKKPYVKPDVNESKPKAIPHIHHMPHHPQTAPMYGPPMNMCPVCGQVNQQMMPHYYPGNVWPPYMMPENFHYEQSMPQQYMTPPMNNQHNYK